MSQTREYRKLRAREREVLRLQGCSAEDWTHVEVTDEFDPAYVRDARFLGSVRLGRFSGNVSTIGGLERSSGIYNAVLCDCTVGDDTRIADIGLHIANYDIGDGVCIENVATMQTNPGATFGNGVEASVLNEAGGREIILFDRLSAQFAYIMCLHRYRRPVVERLQAIALNHVASVRSDRGTVGEGAFICSTDEIIDVNVGPHATISHASSLHNGTVLSSQEAPTTIGVKVIAEDFIVAESSSITGGALLSKVFVGQGCSIGRQYSAENSVFFANCEAFHGEACSIFAGPYTVTHHKSTLLIAGLFSFYNAGSGTNQSNHMYKLGPAHEGRLLRGTKTGSFSYMMWPSKVGPFSVVLGKHSTNFDTADYPFSHLEARADGKCVMIPGLHLTTVGTVRDGAKWPRRDRRKGGEKRDVVSFDVFTPYTIGRMIKASEHLKELQETTDRSVDEVSVGGALVKRLILRTSQKYYRTGIQMYLLECLVDKLERALDETKADLHKAFATDGEAVYSDEWVDIGGQLMPVQRLRDLEDAMEAGDIDSIEAFNAQTQAIDACYKADEWAWARKAYERVFGTDPGALAIEDLREAAAALGKVQTKFLHLVAADAQKEFSEVSHIGFGQDGTDEDVDKDFQAVRGLYEENKFVQEIRQTIEELAQRIARIEKALAKDEKVKN